MAFLTYNQIQGFAGSFEKSQILEKASFLDKEKQVFLSYSSLDKDHIVGTIKFFEQFKANVYVDKDDVRLTFPPSHETAKILKNTINSCPRFVLLVSPNSKNSKWIPWELGLADGFKGTSYIGLLPISDTPIEEDWVKQEYLGLYPRIIWGSLKGQPSEIWKVYDPRDNSSWTLEKWLHDKSLS